MRRLLPGLISTLLLWATTTPLLFAVSSPEAAPPLATDVTVSLPPTATLAVAAFRLVLPAGQPRAIVVLLPGSNSDGRNLVDQEAWRSWAAGQSVALAGVFFRDQPKPDDWIEGYAEANRGSGQSLLDALASLAPAAGRPELAQLPLALVGDSAGGQFAYEFTCWQPDRVLAFVAHKGGVYFTHLAPPAARAVPGLFFIGGKDLAFRRLSLTGIWAMGRRADALWALVDEPDAGHEAVNFESLSRVFLSEVLSQRLVGTQLQPARAEAGWLIGRDTPDHGPAGQAPQVTAPTGWLPGPASAPGRTALRAPVLSRAEIFPRSRSCVAIEQDSGLADHWPRRRQVALGSGQRIRPAMLAEMSLGQRVCF